MRYYVDPLDLDDLQPAETAETAIASAASDAAPAPGSRRSRRTLVALLLPFLLGAWMMWDGTRAAHPTHAARPMTPVAAQAGPDAGHGSASTSLAPTRPPAPVLLPLAAWSPPTRITIPAIGLAAPVTSLGLDRSGRLATPAGRSGDVAGWYQDGVAPGQPGSSLIVLSRAGALHPGDRIDVLRQDGRTVSFAVDAVGPADAVLSEAKSARPATELRLIAPGSPGVIVDARLVTRR